MQNLPPAQMKPASSRDTPPPPSPGLGWVTQNGTQLTQCMFEAVRK
eukprot:SAG31_NODE_31966_length_361_cov_2.000000_1_plen_45_part_10